jgi:SAM-dependent methyltransferase
MRSHKRVTVRGAVGLMALLLAVPACQVKYASAPQTAPVQPRLLSWRVASAYLEDIFARIPNSSIDDLRKDTPAEERRLVNASHGETGLQDDNAHVYGEPAPATTDLMLNRLAVNENDVLYDLGCGRGFFLMQALLSSPMRKAVGVELAASRVALGRQALGLVREQGLLGTKVLDLREQDMTQASLDDATIVYMDSVFFSDALLTTVARNMSRAKNLRAVVMITKGLPPNPWFKLAATERWKMSWSPKFGSDVLFYTRTSAPAG